MPRQFFELLNNISLARKMLLATPWRLNGFRQDGPVLQKQLNIDHLPELRPSRRDIRIGNDFNPVSQRDADRIDDFHGVELIDKNIALE